VGTGAETGDPDARSLLRVVHGRVGGELARPPGSRSGGLPSWRRIPACGSLHWLPGRGRAIELSHTEIAGGHLVERFRLLFIIALGETVLTMGAAFTEEPFALEHLLALAIGFTGTVALWWCYFHRAEHIGVELAERPEVAGTAARWGTWTMTLMVLALIAIAGTPGARDPGSRHRAADAHGRDRGGGRRARRGRSRGHGFRGRGSAGLALSGARELPARRVGSTPADYDVAACLRA
jgi:hypothetical protein